MKDMNCLFVGLSFTDPNLRRLLDIARLQRGDSEIHHYWIKKHYNPKDIEESLKAVLGQSRDLGDEKKRIRSELELDKTTKSLIELMGKFEESDALSFGVGTIWGKDHSEIAPLLSTHLTLRSSSTLLTQRD